MPNFGNWCCATHTQIQSLDCARTTSIHPQRHDSTESSQKRSCKLHPDFVSSGKATRLTQCSPKSGKFRLCQCFFREICGEFLIRSDEEFKFCGIKFISASHGSPTDPGKEGRCQQVVAFLSASSAS